MKVGNINYSFPELDKNLYENPTKDLIKPALMVSSVSTLYFILQKNPELVSLILGSTTGLLAINRALAKIVTKNNLNKKD
jgi:hypothetical protein